MKNQGQHILTLLEAVDDNTTDETLDEIDAQFWCLRKGLEFMYADDEYVEYMCPLENTQHTALFSIKCTRSRDALKAVRLKGWFIHVDAFSESLSEFSARGWSGAHIVNTPMLHTEEIAELHALVQTYMWSDGNA